MLSLRAGFPSLHNYFAVHPYCLVPQRLLPFHCWVVFHCVDIPHLFIHSSVDGHLDSFHLLVIDVTNKVSTNVFRNFCTDLFLGKYQRVKHLGCTVIMF